MKVVAAFVKDDDGTGRGTRIIAGSDGNSYSKVSYLLLHENSKDFFPSENDKICEH